MLNLNSELVKVLKEDYFMLDTYVSKYEMTLENESKSILIIKDLKKENNYDVNLFHNFYINDEDELITFKEDLTLDEVVNLVSDLIRDYNMINKVSLIF